MSGEATSGLGPLSGIAVLAHGDAGPAAVAGWLLGTLGASVSSADDSRVHVALTAGDDVTADVPTARLTGAPPADVAGLPAGTLAYASGIALAGSALLAVLSGGDVEVDGQEIAAQVLLPLALAASHGFPHVEPPAPRPIGRGHVAADLATDDDRAAFERVLTSLGDRALDAEAVADEAQTWRLPVCAFRAWRPAPPAVAMPPSSARDPDHRVAAVPTSAGAVPLDGVTICDFTAMWAGPLATWMLAGAGATVHKIEPAIRLDGTRAGSRAALFLALNQGKQRRDLDVRRDDERAELLELIGASDLVIDSFSRRVMPNWGLDPAALRTLRPDIASVSMPAFPADHRWQVALGPGVHAASGLGDLGGGIVAAPVVAYPDPLAGLTAFVNCLAILLAQRLGRSTEHRDVSLLGCTAPLAAAAPPSTVVAARDETLGAGLLGDALPRSPFRGAWAAVDLAPAPAP